MSTSTLMKVHFRSTHTSNTNTHSIVCNISSISFTSVISVINIMSRRKSASAEALGVHPLHFSPIYCPEDVLLVLEDHGARGEGCPKSHISLLWSYLFLVVLRTPWVTKRSFSVSTLSQLLSDALLPLCTIVVGNLIVLLPRCAQVHRMISTQIFIHETLFALVW